MKKNIFFICMLLMVNEQSVYAFPSKKLATIFLTVFSIYQLSNIFNTYCNLPEDCVLGLEEGEVLSTCPEQFIAHSINPFAALGLWTSSLILYIIHCTKKATHRVYIKTKDLPQSP